MTNIKLNERDKLIIQHIKEFKISTVKTIAKLFFNGKNAELLASRRLKKLYDNKIINRSRRTNVLEEYYYYIGKKPSNAKHFLLIEKAYIDIKSKYTIVKYKREYEIKYKNITLRADLMAICKDNNNKLYAFIIECQNRKIYNDKWTEYIKNKYWKNIFGIEPKILVYSKYNTCKSQIPIEFIKI